MPQQKGGSGAGLGVLMVLVALAFIVGPFFVEKIQGLSQIILVGFGVLLFLVGAIILIITRLYVKTSADESFVRTGMGGQKVIIDGGALVIPVVHKITWVSLNTMRLDVDRKGPDALITGDKLRADIRAEFYIKVDKKKDDVVMAATSLGEKSGSSDSVKELVMEKLVSALRTVAATKPLYDLNEQRDAFASAVQAIVVVDLKHNGLTLETVTVSMLDQTPPDSMKAESNIFDAEGRRKIAQITQQMRIETNQIERNADQEVKKQDTERDQFVYKQETTRATADADKDSNIQKARAKAQQEADTFAAEQDETARVREVARDRQVELANVEKAQQVQVADQMREKEAETARVLKEQAVEVTERSKQVAIANKEKEKADAEAERNKAQKDAEQQHQNVLTVEVTETAKRLAEQAYISKAREIDQEAYEKERQAEADKVAAERQAAARIALANAEKGALIAEAEGKTAVGMVPVNVSQRQVEVDANRVNEVLKPELKAKAEHQEISVKLELGLKQIEVTGEVQKEFARAMGMSLQGAKMNIYGDPGTMAKMMGMFMNGQSVSTMIEGFTGSIDPKAMKTVTDIVGGVKDTITSIFQGIFGKSLDQNTIRGIAEKMIDNRALAAEIQEKAVVALTSAKGQAGLAKLLVDAFGGQFDLEMATKLIAMLKDNPALLDQLNEALAKLPTAENK
jgi:uncharacterized membrane protein YqiK